jgi:hypothetical protein
MGKVVLGDSPEDRGASTGKSGAEKATPGVGQYSGSELAEVGRQCGLVATLIENLDSEALGRLAHGYSKQVAFTVYFDPTKWLESHGAWRVSEEIVRTLLECQKKIRIAQSRGENV